MNASLTHPPDPDKRLILFVAASPRRAAVSF